VIFTTELAILANETGEAMPKSLYRHRAITPDPLIVLPWQLGAEPYVVAAVAIGRQHGPFNLYVPGYPLNRTLLYSSLLGFAHQFNAAFEAPAAGPVDELERGADVLEVPRTLPQVIVPNAEGLALLGRIGRRLAYLPTTGTVTPADPALVRLGRHLQWLARYARTPGQQLILPLSQLLIDHYIVAMSELEMRSLSAMNAWIARPNGMHGYEEAKRAEDVSVGPVPDPDDGVRLYELMTAFNRARAGHTDSATVARYIRGLERQYHAMTVPAWNLMLQVTGRERLRQQAPSVDRREYLDRVRFAEHLAWMNDPNGQGRRRTRPTPIQAIKDKHLLESTTELLLAEEATDDALRMAPFLLTDKAFAGEVIANNLDRKETPKKLAVRRPLIVVATDEMCLTPVGTEVWWSAEPDGKQWIVHNVTPVGAGSRVEIILQTSNDPKRGMPTLGDRVCFSTFSTGADRPRTLPSTIPWTHRPPAELAVAEALDATSDGDRYADQFELTNVGGRAA
jgi:hypothetical protein